MTNRIGPVGSDPLADMPLGRTEPPLPYGRMPGNLKVPSDAYLAMFKKGDDDGSA